MAMLDPRILGGVPELVAYVAAVLLAWLLAVLVRAVLRGGGAEVPEPAPEHVAYLTGGPLQAVYAAVAALRSTGSVHAADGRIFVSGPVPAGGGELAAAVHHAARVALPVLGLPAHPVVRAELDRIGDRLRRGGALLSPGRRRAMAVVAVPLFVVALLGGARFALTVPTGDIPEPQTVVLVVLTVLCAMVALVASIVVAGSRQIRTRGANRLVRDLRRRYAALAPGGNLSLAGNGPAAATLAVGLFGTAALWAGDPAFARAANVEEQNVTSGGGYGGDAGYRVDDGSSCGSP